MRRKALVATLFALALVMVGQVPLYAQGPVGTAFTYQGLLKQDGTTVNGETDFRFSLWRTEGADSGTQVGPTLLFDGQGANPSPLDIVNGLFTVALDFGDAVFTGEKRWLMIEVRVPHDPTDTLPYAALTPNQQIMAAPHALALPGLWTDYPATAGSPNLMGGHPDNAVTAGVEGATIGGGGDSAGPNIVTDDYSAVGGGSHNQAGDNAGTTDDATFAVVGGGYNNTASAAQATVGGGHSNTASGVQATVAGGISNQASGVYAAVCGGTANQASAQATSVLGGWNNLARADYATAGGGQANHADATYSFVGGGKSNSIVSSYATIAGGNNNSAAGEASAIGGGEFNSTTSANSNYATIGGGSYNAANADYATIAGGGPSDPGDPNNTRNQVWDKYGTIGGGGSNLAGSIDGNTESSMYATVGGGGGNEASGTGATIPGGMSNRAAGNYSFAAGLQAKADHSGSFVWADSTGVDLASTGDDQFLIRAGGGVGIGTAAPSSPLTVAGMIESTVSGFKFPDGSVQTTASTGGGGNAWSLSGNAGTSPPTNFLGTTDDTPLELKVNNSRALRLEPHVACPNVIAGHPENFTYAGVYGATISGGGMTAALVNSVLDNHCTVGGGLGNAAGFNDDDPSTQTCATVSGGFENEASGSNATVGGGFTNHASGDYSSIGGGQFNEAGDVFATVGGGMFNLATAGYATIAGGGPSDPDNPTTTNNRVFDDYGTVGGGGDNWAGNDDDDPLSAKFATVSGGRGNRAGAVGAVVGGGYGNQTNAGYAVVSGGYDSIASGPGTTVGGGYYHNVSGAQATIAGGNANWASGDYSAVSGGTHNTASSRYTAVGGGTYNVASGRYAAVGGGLNNFATGNYGAVIAGGWHNTASGVAAMVPGGSTNIAEGDYSFAAGQKAWAGHSGAFVWADASDPGNYLESTADNQFLIRAIGGVGIGTTAPSSPLHVVDALPDSDRPAVQGEHTVTDDRGVGVKGVGGYKGVEGIVQPSGSLYYCGVQGEVSGGSGSNFGVLGHASGAGTNYGVHGFAGGGTTNYAGYFDGDVHVTGTLSGGGVSFRIDHPLDPGNKYLCHSCVESPDMMNVYSGDVVTDDKGYAAVELPEWFEALNRDFRYQLTVLDEADGDTFVLAKVVRKIEGNRFTIRTSAPFSEVSWQVTGIRQDAWAEAHLIPVEVDKPESERGTHLYPRAFGVPQEPGRDDLQHPASQQPGKPNDSVLDGET